MMRYHVAEVGALERIWARQLPTGAAVLIELMSR